MAESFIFDTSGGAVKVVQRAKASTVVGLQKAYAEVPAGSTLGFIGAGSVFSDHLTLSDLDLTPTDLNPGPGDVPRPIPALNVDVRGRVISSLPEVVASGPFFEIRYLALLSATELSLTTFAEFLVGLRPKPMDTYVVSDRTWDEESFPYGFGVNEFSETFTGNLAYAVDATTVRYGGWAYSGFYVVASEYYKLDFFNSVNVSIDLPAGASLSTASGFDYVAAVPEPAAVTMMLAGFFVVAFAIHQRKRASRRLAGDSPTLQ